MKTKLRAMAAAAVIAFMPAGAQAEDPVNGAGEHRHGDRRG